MINTTETILYAEDDEEDRFVFLDGVRSTHANVQIIIAGNGLDVVNYLRTLSPEKEYPMAIVSDLRMPLCDGLDMLRLVKQEPRWKSIPVILFSTSSSRTEIATATQLGVEAFFTKPGTYHEFVDMVRSILTICRKNNSTGPSSLC